MKIYKRRTPTIMDACVEMHPDMYWSMSGDDYSTFEWFNQAVDKPTEAELVEKAREMNALEPLIVIRRSRDKALAESDWIVTKALENGQPVPQEWATYRQALRDITVDLNYTIDPDTGEIIMTWPTKPV